MKNTRYRKHSDVSAKRYLFVVPGVYFPSYSTIDFQSRLINERFNHGLIPINVTSYCDRSDSNKLLIKSNACASC